MGVFFNGRLWTTPAVMSVVDDSAMYNKNLSVGNVQAVIGASTGGQPNTALSFGSPAEAVATLRSGELLDAILHAFDPSSETGSPQTIIAVRVNPAVQASLMLKDSSAANVINLQSTDYGLWTNGIKAKIEAATTTGMKLSTQVGNSYFSQDNVYRNAFSVVYGGAQATAVMTISGTQLILEAPTSTNAATIELASYPTVQALVDRINVVTGFTATVLDGNGNKATPNALDYVTGVSVKTLYTATAHLQATVDWFNGAGEGFVTATRQATAGKTPAVLDWTYLTGGSDGLTTNTQWSDAYTVLQAEDVQWVTPVSANSAIHAMNDTHCTFMTNVVRMERRGIVGSASATSDDAAIVLAKALGIWAEEKKQYASSIKWEYTGDFSARIWTEYKLAEQIENGRPARDLKLMLNTSLKVRTAQNGKNAGKRYLIIPLSHNTPGNSAHADAMPQSIYDAALQLKPSRVTGMGRRESGTGAWDPKTRAPLTVPQRKYAWGGQLETADMNGITARQARKYQGMVRFDTKGKGAAPSSQFLTFRVMMEGSSGWVTQPQPGRHFVPQVTSRLQPLAEQVIAKAVQLDLSGG